MIIETEIELTDHLRLKIEHPANMCAVYHGHGKGYVKIAVVEDTSGTSPFYVAPQGLDITAERGI